MTDRKGLTEINEQVRGFVGRRNLKYGQTDNGKSKITFDLGAGITDESQNKYATWRHCIAYGDVAELIKDIRPGNYLSVTGYIVSNARLDEYYKPVKDFRGYPVMDELLICQKILVQPHQNIQEKLPLVVGQASKI